MFDHRRLWNRHRDVTPSSADVQLPSGCMAIVVNGTAGTVALEDAAGTQRTYTEAVIAELGLVIPGRWAKVLDTGTTAAGLICWYWSPP